MGMEGELYLGGVWRGGEYDQNTMSENLKELIKKNLLLVKAESRECRQVHMAQEDKKIKNALWVKECMWPLETANIKKQILPRVSRREHGPTNTLTLD